VAGRRLFILLRALFTVIPAFVLRLHLVKIYATQLIMQRLLTVLQTFDIPWLPSRDREDDNRLTANAS